MARYVIVTVDGKTITVEHSADSVRAVLDAARADTYLEATELTDEQGRTVNRTVVITYHAIVLVRPKS